MIRSPRKIGAVINNARCYQKVREEFGSFCNYIWGYSNGKTILYQGHDKGPIPVSNGLSDRISKDLKKRGFKYVGAITIYSHLQACGIICDHDPECLCYQTENRCSAPDRAQAQGQGGEILSAWNIASSPKPQQFGKRIL